MLNSAKLNIRKKVPRLSVNKPSGPLIVDAILDH